MLEWNFDSIIEKYVEMNVVHHFREGNGRAARIWLDLIFKSNIAMCIDWSKINKEDYLSAMERKINDIQVYTTGIQRSYECEGYYTE